MVARDIPLSFFQTWPPQFHEYTISFDFYIRALPGEEKCEVQNALAIALNSAIAATVHECGSGRHYVSPFAESRIEEMFEFYLSAIVAAAFPLDHEVNVPTLTPPHVGVNLIKGIPGEFANCCD